LIESVISVALVGVYCSERKSKPEKI